MRFLFILILFFPLLAKAENFEVNSKSHILIEQSTNTILSENNSHDRMPIASLTKIMTIYILFDFIENNNIDKNTVVPISTNAVSTARRTNSSRSFFEERHTVTIEDIIKSLIIHSGNDAAIAIAEFISGTEHDFSDLMNDYAIKLGMHNTLYANASGLPTAINTQYSTAYDQSILSRRLISDFKDYYDLYFNKKEYTHNNIFQQSRNRLLFINPQFDGIKTGWTREAGYSYSTSIYNNGRRLIIVTLNADKPEHRFQDAINLSNYAFEKYSNISIAKNNSTIQGMEKIPLLKSNYLFANIYNESDIVLTIERDKIKKLRIEINIPDKLIAPLIKDQPIGTLNLLLDNNVIAHSNILIENDYPIGSIKSYLLDSFLMRLNN